MLPDEMNYTWLVPLVLVVATSWISGGLGVSVLVGSSVVYPNQYLMSVNGQYSLVLLSDCNIVIYNLSQPLLATNITSSPPNCSLWMQDDGNLVLYNFTSITNTSQLSAPYALWNENYYSAANGNRSFLLLDSDGLFRFYNTNSTERPSPGNNLYESLYNLTDNSGFSNLDVTSDPTYTAWKSNASLADYPYMPAEYFLSADNRLLTLSGTYDLKLGTDCNLQSRQLLYEGGNVTLWSTETQRTDDRTCQLSLQRSGILQILDTNSGVSYWNSTTDGDSNVNWILKVNPDNGSLSISDIQNSSRVLWTNTQTQTGAPDIAPSGSHNSSGSSIALIVGVVVGVVGGAFVLAMAALGLYLCARERFLDPSDKAFQERLRAKGGTSFAFSQAKIKQATKNYENVIGHGGFGDVFKGQLPTGQEVAAKVLSANSHQSKHEFYNEIELLSMVHHKYLVSLVGYSCTRTHQVLIYEFMGGGDLRHRLQGESAAKNPLSWRQRTSIILQVAEGLEYLHDKCSPPIIHRDVKSTNILLTEQLVAKVADFGLSKLKTIGQEDATHVSTVVKGTPGYLDPEYHESGLLTEKSDVYAFGIVLMEILTGRHYMSIAQYVGEAWRQEQFDGLADPNLEEDFDREELVSLAELALRCVRRSSAERPFMRQVVRRLHDLGLGASPELFHPDMKLGEGYDHDAMDIELIAMGLENLDSETQPFSGSSSSSKQRERLVR